MLRWCANLFILTAITGMFGFGRMSSFFAKLLFVLLSVLSFVAVVSHMAGRGFAYLIPRRPVGTGVEPRAVTFPVRRPALSAPARA